MTRSSLVFSAVVAVGLLGVAAFVPHGGLLNLNAAVAPAEVNAEDGVTVVIDNFSFMAPTLTVPVGTKVTWINHDDVPHTIVSTEQKFKSKAIDTDEKFSYVFSDAGTFPYFCSIHPKMVANIVVTAKKAVTAEK